MGATGLNPRILSEGWSHFWVLFDLLLDYAEGKTSCVAEGEAPTSGQMEPASLSLELSDARGLIALCNDHVTALLI